MKFWPWNWNRRKQDLQEELEAHLRMAMEDRVERGETPEQARAAALCEMGNMPLVADVTRRQWGWAWLEQVNQDVRHAIRQLRKSPGYTTTALLTLTLAVGANTAIFGLFYALLLRSLPVEHPEQIVQVELQLWGPGVTKDTGDPSEMVSDGLYDALAKTQSVFSGMCGWSENRINLREADGTRPVPAASLTGGCFGTLGVHAALGRLLEDADDRPGGTPEGYPIVLGFDYWRTHFAADPGVIGRVMDFGAGYRAKGNKGIVVGVAERGFDSVRVGEHPSIYVPLEMTDPLSGHNLQSFDTTLLARLKDGVPAQTAQAQADAILQTQLKPFQEAKKFPYYVVGDDGFKQASQAHIVVMPGRTGSSYLRREYERPLFLIEGMVGLSLLVACAYLAMLSSARALGRRRELAVRMALGASRRRLAAQLCYESVLLAVAGSVLGIIFAWGAGRALLVLLKLTAEGSIELRSGPSGMVLLFTLGIAGLTVILSGVWPAWRASKVDPARDIKEGETSIAGRGTPRAGAWLVPVQIAFSLVIVIMAALMGSTVARLIAVDPGFSTRGITFLGADFSPRAQNVGGEMKRPTVPSALLLSLFDRIRHTPGVEAASISQAYPLLGAMYLQGASSTLRSGEIRKDRSMTSLSVTPGFFQTLGIPILEGRDFTLDNRGDAAPVCILSRSAARYFFPAGNAVGSTLAMGENKNVRVVAVVGDTLYSDLREPAPRIFYQPFLEGSMWNPFAKIAVRARDTGTAVAAVRGAFRELAPDVAVDQPVTMTELVRRTMGREQLVAILASFFALLTLVLTGIGLYGVLNYGVVRRRTELGVRMALGASQAAVVRLILREAFMLVLPGLLLGAAGAWGATRLLSSLLFGVKPMDPWMCAVSLTLLLAAATSACLLPAWRAARFQPMDALRFD
jgi:predicted permease